jgi:serine/threonine protein kinase
MNERESSSSSGRKCPRCGTELPVGTPSDLCPKCLLQAALPTEASQSPSQTAVIPPLPSRPRGPQPGEQLGHYRVIRPLGEGGMGAVYDAEDLESGRRVALKLLGQKLDSPEARERFFREGRLAASINHPNSVYVFGTEEIGGTPAIAMELVAGGTLQDRVRECGPLPVAEAVDSVLQIIAGLEAAQRIGILHRDVKPSNCFRDTDGTVKVGDFGLSISTSVRTEPALTAKGMFLGTPAFCSPEQLRGDELNVRSDMYSVGATLYYLLTARTPFEGKNSVQLLATVLEQRAPSPLKFRSGIPSSLARIVLRCLEKMPGDRYKSYQELSRALAPYSSIAPTPATLGLRCAAGVLDHFVLSIISTFAMFLAGKGPFDFLNLASRSAPRTLALVAPSIASMILYYAFLEGFWGASLGKAICRLRVVGPDGNVPRFWRAFIRALIYVVAPLAPVWLIYGMNPMAYTSASSWVQIVLGFSFYIVLALLFSTARRRNGFAAVQDIVTKTRVISRVTLESRPALAPAEIPDRAAEARAGVGPYQVFETLEQSSTVEWLLGYDLRLLRKVWILVVPPGSPPVPLAWRNLARINRLRWLTGRRSTDENWDAFECPTGKSLLDLARTRQPWGQVRYWLYDLAAEIGLAAKEGTLPEVFALDRVWITDDGRAKLLDFPAPGARQPSPAIDFPSEGFKGFLTQVAASALNGSAEPAAENGFPVPVPLPLHARRFLEQISQFPSPDAAAATLKPLLQRVAQVTRWRRAAIAAGCLVMPAISALAITVGFTLLQRWDQSNPGVFELNNLLHQRTSINSHSLKNQPQHPTDRQFEIYIANHYGPLITNEDMWKGGLTVTLIKGEDRKFAEKSVAENPAPTNDEISEADAAFKQMASPRLHDMTKQPFFPFFMACIVLVIYVCIPALIATLLFRGGLLLFAARVTYVCKDGEPASRLRLFWRALVVWSPLLIILVAFAMPKVWFSPTAGAISAVSLLCIFAIISIGLPERGLQDRLAGVWPVPC